MAQPLKIVIAIPWHFGCLRAVLRGVSTYAKQENWNVRLGEPFPGFIKEMTRWKPDGFIIDPDIFDFLPSVQLLNAPAVVVPDVWNAPDLPGVSMDNLAIGRMAAEYFLDRGFRSFAHGVCSGPWSDQRKEGFERCLQENNLPVQLLPLTTILGEGGLDPQYQQWLKDAPKPLAIFAANDVAGHKLSQICHDLDLQIPDQVAIIGVDNDDVFVQLATPALSSIELPWERMGFEAAQMLELLIRGGVAPRKPVLLPPTSVVTRQSSDVMAVSDPNVKLALRFIAEHATEKISVEDVVNATTVSRRVLERQFQELLRKTPLDEIRAVRLARAKQLLINSDLSITQVAQRSGFGSGERFCVSFQNALGFGPLAYRHKFRLPPPAPEP